MPENQYHLSARQLCRRMKCPPGVQLPRHRPVRRYRIIYLRRIRRNGRRVVVITGCHQDFPPRQFRCRMINPPGIQAPRLHPGFGAGIVKFRRLNHAGIIPAAASTWPFCNRASVCPKRAKFIDSVLVHAPATGSYNSALAVTEGVDPPVTSTVPSASNAAAPSLRPVTIRPVTVHVPAARNRNSRYVIAIASYHLPSRHQDPPIRQQRRGMLIARRGHRPRRYPASRSPDHTTPRSPKRRAGCGRR